MVRFTAQYYDGKTSKTYPIDVSLQSSHLKLSGSAINRLMPVNTLALAPPVGTSVAIIYGPNDEEMHTKDLAAFAELTKVVAPNHNEHVTRFLETRYQYALAALVFSVAFIAVGLRWGLPAFALLIATWLPADLEKLMGDQTLRMIDKTMVAPSQLSNLRQKNFRHRLRSICDLQTCPAYTLHFRKGRVIGANAFALPAGDVVITDELIKMAKNDAEILAVLFHELGHVKHRHSLRLAIQSAGAAALLVVITGDLSSVSDIAAGLPSLLMQSGYQRDMEREADAHALNMLKAACLPPKHFSDIMTRLSKASGEDHSNQNSWGNLLDSHPDTPSRIQAFQANSAC